VTNPRDSISELSAKALFPVSMMELISLYADRTHMLRCVAQFVHRAAGKSTYRFKRDDCFETHSEIANILYNHVVY